MFKVFGSCIVGFAGSSRSSGRARFSPVPLLFCIACLGNVSVPASANAATDKLQSGSTAANVPAMRIVISKGFPWLCPEAYWGSDCGTVGDLHNEALAATLGATPPGQPQQRSVAETVAQLQKWTPKMGQLAAVLHNREEMSKLTSLLTERLGAAGIVDDKGHAIHRAFNDPTKFVSYLEANGQISPALAGAVRQSLAKNVSIAEFAKVLSDTHWSGNDVKAAAIMSNVLLSSSTYWSHGIDPSRIHIRQGDVGPASLPYLGFWDCLGALLLSETGPGSIVGGYVMSCLAAGTSL